MLNTPDENFWRWVDSHISDDTAKLRLKYPKTTEELDYPLAITQIECRRRFGKKLSDTLSSAPHFLFPSKLSGEQSTSDALAAYHATLVIKGLDMVDMTSGLGIDALHCSRNCNIVTAIERNQDTARALEINVPLLSANNINVICGDSRDYLSTMSGSTGTVFIDPARRNAEGGRVFALSDCEPDVTSLLPVLASRCRRTVIKMSPMLDISHTVSELNGCSEIIAIGNATECKELLAVKDFSGDDNPTSPVIKAVTMLNDRIITFCHTQDEEHKASMPSCTEPVECGYIYEPYPSTMKAGAIKLIANRFNLDIFHPNTRLYHSSEIRIGFPGEIFKIEKIIEFASKNIKRLHREYPSLSVTTRNFGMTADALRNKLGVKDGGDKRLFGVTDSKGKRIMIITSGMSLQC